jgi:pyruvate dehydrogenase E1 component
MASEGVLESPGVAANGEAANGAPVNGEAANGVPPSAAVVADADPAETREWLDALAGVLQTQGTARASYLLTQLKHKAFRSGVQFPFTANTPYLNTIPRDRQAPFPGSREIERRIKSLVRWNAMAMVVRANKQTPGIGGHISTFASAATLYEIGFNHFFKGPDAPGGGDLIYIQGHASPGIYARAFLEGRFSAANLEHFRRELAEGGGLSSYPHPWLMPNFWQFPTVSMGLGPIMAIYQARYNRYLEHRGLKDTTNQRVWCFMGDGETDEPESLGALTLASREKLDNLTFVINCNLQRLDGPVRGNGKIIQELEAAFRGAGWNVVKVIWSSEWDALVAQDKDGWLARRMEEVVDGEFQKYGVESPQYVRQHFFGKYPELAKLVENLSDDQIRKLSRGGHDPEKVYAAYHTAVHHRGAPTVILAKTVKGYGLGEAGEGRNITHQAKKLNEDELHEFRSRFGIPISDEELHELPFYKPGDDSRELVYLQDRRKALGGPLPARKVQCPPLKAPPISSFKQFLQGSGGTAASTTMAFVTILNKLLQDKDLGKWVVPIIPDEARTFGMEGMFTKYGIYSNVGQLYDPVDSKTLTRYREAKDGQILEEGITEAGSMSSFTAAGTAYATHGIPTIPFFIYYSMFGFQRIGDLIWAAADMRVRGFLLGGTAGRTTLNGEGLQHQDGHSHVLASTVPNCLAYDPAYAYEIAVIIQDGIRRMYQEGESVFYYLTLGNENYPMEAMPEGSAEGILSGMYKFRPSSISSPRAGEGKVRGENGGVKSKVHLLGSGAILNETLRAQQLLAEKFEVAADVWSVTSYKKLRRDALECERWNRLHPAAEGKRSYLEKVLANEKGVFIAASDYMKLVPEMIARWVPGGLTPLGTDGFGRSETRQALRRHFEVDAECIAVAALDQLARRGEIKPERVAKAIKELGVDPEKVDPVRA